MVETDLVDHAKQAFAWATASVTNFLLALALAFVSCRDYPALFAPTH